MVVCLTSFFNCKSLSLALFSLSLQCLTSLVNVHFCVLSLTGVVPPNVFGSVCG